MQAKALYKAILARLEQAEIEDAGFDGLQLFAHHTGMEISGLLTHPEKEISGEVETALWESVEKRCGGEPLQYILGSWEFYGLPFTVGRGVLIPRADTEVLVDEALRLLEGVENPKIADLCAGSGCIGITLAKNREDAQVTLLELSNDAGNYCQKNIEQNGAKNATLFMRDILEGPKDFCELDMIVSNPPYIPAEDMKTLSREVQAEPQMALLGGEDGLDFYRFIISHWTPALKSTGAMVLEVGIHQADAVEQLLSEQFEQVYIVPDLNNIPRVLLGVTRK